LCNVLRRTSNNEKNIERISTIIRDNVQTPSVLGAIKQILQPFFYGVVTSASLTISIGISAGVIIGPHFLLSFLAKILDTLEFLGHGTLGFRVGILCGFVIGGVHTLCSNIFRKKHYFENVDKKTILYVPAQ
jgi:hypothetical protein